MSDKIIHDGPITNAKEKYLQDIKNQKNWFKKLILIFNYPYFITTEYVSKSLHSNK